jgi:hypothetical protein
MLMLGFLDQELGRREWQSAYPRDQESRHDAFVTIHVCTYHAAIPAPVVSGDRF